MFRSKTLFVVGAGASQEVGFPLGVELKQKISALLDIKFRHGYEQYSGDHEITEALAAFARRTNGPESGINRYLNMCWRIRDAMPQALSIDNFLEAHSSNEELVFCGKLAIARAILEAERQSALHLKQPSRQQLDFSGLANTWYSKIFQRLHEGVPKEAAEQIFENVSFISFNYDRSLEQYFPYAIQNYYDVRYEEACEIASGLRIIHPYGVCGSLPWQNRDRNVGYGESEYPETLLSVASQIRTFTERIEDEGELREIRKEVANAARIVFLGFAFHPMNMEILKLEQKSRGSGVYGTALGISAKDCEIIKRLVAETLHRPEEHVWQEIRPDLSCSQLFDQYWRALGQ